MIDRERPPYLAAAAAAALVLAGYLFTLAPTVTFWDAGELIAAAKTLGIPHPPGTPLWVMLAHVWGLLIPFGDYAWRLNLMSAVGGAIAAGCWFLVAYTLARRADRAAPSWVAHGAGVAAALLTAFNFTNWQNAVEAEVYSVAMVTIGAAAWCAVRWCDLRDDRRGQRLMLVLTYLGAISIGNHLLALLVGPALVALLAAESWRNPLLDVVRRSAEHARIGLVAATWLLLIALGLGSATLTALTGVLVAVAVVQAGRHRQLSFAAATLAIVVIGISPYLFLYLRAQQGPYINEADPSTWDALLAVIRRAQYPIRTPLDDPTVAHGPGNPGRSLTLLGYQVANYFQYFDWQWGRGLGLGPITAWPRLLVTAIAVALGIRGAQWQWRRDRAGWWFVAVAFAVTGLGLVLYMNFKPGPSIGFDRWAAFSDHEVRERDYFFVASFVSFAVWIALGLAATVRSALQRAPTSRWPALFFAAALVPVLLNGPEASRRHGPDTTLARDFARALLASVPPGGILFTWGDNDTFPLWHAQAVDGIRPDVILVCLALAETPWYQRQLRELVPGAVDREALPAVWRDVAGPTWDGPVHALSDEQIEAFRPQLADQEYELPLGEYGRLLIPEGTAIYAKDMLLFAVVSANVGRRPIAWSVTAAQKLFGASVIQQGLTLVMPLVPPDPTDIDTSAMLGAATPLDVRVTTALMRETWQFGELLTADLRGLDPNVGSMAATLTLPYARTAVAMLARADTTAAIAMLETAAHLSPGQPGLAEFALQLRMAQGP